MSLPPEVRTTYIAIIDKILNASDLKTISAKQIRKGLQSAVDHDITPRKETINALIVERFDNVENQQKRTHIEPSGTFNGPKADDANRTPESATTSSRPSPVKREHTEKLDGAPAKKKSKHLSPEDDAAFAARLQAEENSRARSTRGSATVKRQATSNPVKRKGKSASKVKADDDSDLDPDNEDGKSVKRTGAFHKPMSLSTPLGELLGETSLSRPQTVKKIWEYVKAHELQNPEDKRQIMCDDAMRAVFKQDTVHMFTMNKILSNHLYPEDE